MALGVRKPGQGYWVRVLSAVFAGVLGMAGAAWAWSEVAAIPLPDKSWQFSVDGLRGNPEVGSTIEMVGADPADPLTPIVIGAGTVEQFTPASSGSAGSLVVGSLEMKEAPVTLKRGWQGSFVEQIRSSEGGATTAVRADVRQWVGIPVVPMTYVQGAAAGVIILITAGLLLHFVGANRKSVDFLIATDGEMKKVNWSTRREVIGSTQVVIVATFLIAAILFLIDIGFSTLFKAVGVLIDS